MDMCQPTRRSRRLQNLSPTGDPSAVVSPLPEVAAATEEDEVVDYTFMPQDPRGLDNFEFLVYTELRKWRLQRKRELEIEPYKICQNRTLCELIRSRRNNKTFAMGKRTAVDEDLLSVWGIGPQKVKQGGFGHELLAVLNEAKNEDLLIKSRLLKSLPEIKSEPATKMK